MGSLKLGLALLLVVGIGAVSFLLMTRGDDRNGAVKSTGAVAIGGPFRLFDHAGKIRTDADFRGKPMLIFFGFTNCPDICPTVLQTAGDVLSALGSDADKVHVVFVAVDSKRDTPSRLKAYRESFDKRIVMLGGSETAIRQVVKNYRVSVIFQKPDANGNYAVDHSAYLYLMNKKGRFVTHFRHLAPAKKIAQTISKSL